jgi:uncharacterized protein
MGNPVVQWQVLSRNPDAHAAFYADLFAWTVSADNPLGYRFVDTGSERGIPGGFWPAPPEAQPFVQLFVEVADLDATIATARATGAGVLIPPQNLPGGEAMAVLRDPEGMTFAIYRPAVS